MRIKKKHLNDKDYFYLEHSYRDGSKIIKKEIYLGVKLPSNIEKIKLEFNNALMKEIYYNKFELIKKHFLEEFKAMPISARKKYLHYFVVKFTYDTNRIEGNTITLKETARLLEDGISPSNKSQNDIKEIESHKKVFQEIMVYQRDLSLQIILKWHKMLLAEVSPDIAGRIRTHQVKVAGSKTNFPSPVEINPLLDDFMAWYRKNRTKFHPLKLAVLVHLKFVSIHPFTDGNGRMSRLLMNFVLHKYGYPMLNIKYSNRNNYYNALEQAQIKKQERIFILHIFRRYLKEYVTYFKK